MQILLPTLKLFLQFGAERFPGGKTPDELQALLIRGVCYDEAGEAAVPRANQQRPAVQTGGQAAQLDPLHSAPVQPG